MRERGTQRPSVRQSELAQHMSRLSERDPAVQVASLEARTRYLFRELHRSWAAHDLTALRALVSDGMFDSLRYWIEAYRAQGLQNVLEDSVLSRLEPVKVVQDRHFDAVTLRLFATGKDYTVDAVSGSLVSGSRQQNRAYSEYWTLIRSAQTRGAPRADASCPSCAAPLVVSMAGQCSHCGSHITRGEFDWVLSKIEQDDVYEG